MGIGFPCLAFLLVNRQSKYNLPCPEWQLLVWKVGILIRPLLAAGKQHFAQLTHVTCSVQGEGEVLSLCAQLPLVPGLVSASLDGLLGWVCSMPRCTETAANSSLYNEIYLSLRVVRQHELIGRVIVQAIQHIAKIDADVPIGLGAELHSTVVLVWEEYRYCTVPHILLRGRSRVCKAVLAAVAFPVYADFNISFHVDPDMIAPWTGFPGATLMQPQQLDSA